MPLKIGKDNVNKIQDKTTLTPAEKLKLKMRKAFDKNLKNDRLKDIQRVSVK